MDGVTILTQHDYVVNSPIVISGFMFSFCLCTIMVLSWLVLDGPKNGHNHECASLCFIFSLCFLIFMCVGRLFTEHVEYKVIIDDSVNFNAFMERYEIVEQDGQLFTVKERGDINE